MKRAVTVAALIVAGLVGLACNGNDAEPDQPAGALTCDDFETRDEAQRAYNRAVQSGQGDTSKMDPDGDGQACEDLPQPRSATQS